MRFTLDLDMFFDFLTPFSFILRFQPILLLQNSRVQKRDFWTFCGFFDVGTWLWRWFWTHIRFPHQRPDKIQAKATFDAQQTCLWPFLRLFKGPSGQTWPIYAGKICKKGDFLNFRFFWTLRNDCDGDFELTFDFHTEDMAKYRRKTTFDARKTCFWPFLRLLDRPTGQTCKNRNKK